MTTELKLNREEITQHRQDPAAELVARLLDYEKLKRQADALEKCGFRGAEWMRGKVDIEIPGYRPRKPDISAAQMQGAFGETLRLRRKRMLAKCKQVAPLRFPRRRRKQK